MERDAYLAAVTEESAMLADSARAALSLVVPSCPGWTMRDLVVHIGEVHRRRYDVIESGSLDPPGEPDIMPPPAGEIVLDWFLSGANRLVRLLSERDDADPVYTWYPPDQTVGFWVRRMAQETLVHRWDADHAVSRIRPIDPELAADGVDELLRVFLTDPEAPWTGEPADVAVRATDVGRDWVVHLDPAGITVSDGTGDAQATVSAPADDLLLVLWRRVPADRAEVTGDADLGARLIAQTDTS